MLITAAELPSKPYVAFATTRAENTLLVSGHVSARAAKVGAAKLEAQIKRMHPDEFVAVVGWGIIDEGQRKHGYVI